MSEVTIKPNVHVVTFRRPSLQLCHTRPGNILIVYINYRKFIRVLDLQSSGVDSVAGIHDLEPATI